MLNRSFTEKHLFNSTVFFAILNLLQIKMMSDQIIKNILKPLDTQHHI